MSQVPFLVASLRRSTGEIPMQNTKAAILFLCVTVFRQSPEQCLCFRRLLGALALAASGM